MTHTFLENAERRRGEDSKVTLTEHGHLKRGVKYVTNRFWIQTQWTPKLGVLPVFSSLPSGPWAPPLGKKCASSYSRSFHSVMSLIFDPLLSLPAGGLILQLVVRCWGVCFVIKNSKITVVWSFRSLLLKLPLKALLVCFFPRSNIIFYFIYGNSSQDWKVGFSLPSSPSFLLYLSSHPPLLLLPPSLPVFLYSFLFSSLLLIQ